MGDKHLLIWREEGVGDELRFATCLPDLISSFPGNITFECSPRLYSLFQRSFPEIRVIPYNPDRSDFSPFDCHIPVGSLPRIYRSTIDKFPQDNAFLTPDPALMKNYSRQLELIGDGPKIGLSWRSLNNSWRKKMSQLTINDCLPFLTLPNIKFVSLQTNVTSDDLDRFEVEFGVKIHKMHDLDLTNDLEGSVALMKSLDAIISSRCWVMGFGGACGVSTHLLSNNPNAMAFNQNQEPWFPKVKVHYRSPHESWQNATKSVAKDLTREFALLDLQ